MSHYEVQPEPEIEREIEERHVRVDALVKEAVSFMDQPDVDDTALARMFIDRGFSEQLSYWLVREAEVRHAPGQKPTTAS